MAISYDSSVGVRTPTNADYGNVIFVNGPEEALKLRKPYGFNSMVYWDRNSNLFYLVKYDDNNVPSLDKTFRFYDVSDDNIKESEETKMMNTNMFNGIFGKIAPGMCRISMSGKIAIKTSSGYKAYDVESGRLTNCDSFAFDIGEDFFFVMPTNRVKRGDIILIGGKPRCVLGVEKNRVSTMNYEDGSLQDIVPERHIFMSKQYFYGRIVSMFGEMGKGSGDKGMKQMMKFMMMKEMMGGSSDTSGFGSMIPMMAMMSGFGGNFFDGMFDFDDDDEEIESGFHEE